MYYFLICFVVGVFLDNNLINCGNSSFVTAFLCSICGKGFKNPTNLRTHVKRHTPTKPVACPKCPKRFFDKHGLKKHIEVHDDAQFVCDICGSVMRSKASYNEHKSNSKIHYSN